MTLEFTQAAVSDLQSIRNYTLVNWGEQQETAYLDALWTKFGDILAEPLRWKFRHDLFPFCQIAASGKHVILFRVQVHNLQIVRILHGAMDYPRHIPKHLE
jgi:toxin ParE1/3/4